MAKKNESKSESLPKELLLERKNGFHKISDKDMEKATAFCETYKEFLNAAKTERESVDYVIKHAEKHGFVAFDSQTAYQPGDKVYYNNRGKAICLAVIGSDGCKDGVRILAAHIDSPRLDLKPIPLYESNELALLKTHYYGGIKKYQWTTIPLSMHGKIVKRDGSEVTVNIGEKEGDPQFCITDILPHLGKDQAAKKLGEAIEGESLNILAGSLPVDRQDGEKLYKLNVLKILNKQYGVIEEDLISAEIEFVPAFKAADVGFDRSMVGAYGHDDRVCAYSSIEAIFNCKKPKQTVVTVLADKEEVGSNGNTGLASNFLSYFITDLAEKEGFEGRHVLSKSTCLSADVTAAYDPTYASAYEIGNSTFINHGVALAKYTGSRGKSGCNDSSAEFLGKVRKVFNDHDILWQIGELGKVDQGGGGTVAFTVSALNADVIDVGVPVLSMHAPWEVVSKIDVYMAYKGFKAFLED
ncbi:aminopeptidase [Scatolibacter rhodanostii]|uniref:aminopeptidase n=1 Tax=Scatolibacter rhodanostii TaxID=2014781 RepID=UPI00190E92E6|nr:aminopeptidase [Scatolibacter rhodanostii]